ncbi:Ig-like domain-containing protein, partial [Mesorhizobium sp. M0317]|uniref:cadherin-like domain-containing protein n=1 Tax=Mesorhizobium sp. M0317 TaxID=2956935 RepID=UPI00333A433D
GYANFTFQVQDDGTTANGGVDLDQSPNTMTLDVTSVNDAPAGTSNTVTVNEDGAHTFTAADFGFSDPTDAASAAGADALLAVEITTLPGAGSLTNDGIPVTAGQFVSVADINAGKLVFTPAADANGTGYANFTFQVQDDGTTANGGVDLDQSPNTFTINVTSVNDAPVNTVPALQTVAEDTNLSVTGLAIADVDAGSATNITTTLSVLHG